MEKCFIFFLSTGPIVQGWEEPFPPYYEFFLFSFYSLLCFNCSALILTLCLRVVDVVRTRSITFKIAQNQILGCLFEKQEKYP